MRRILRFLLVGFAFAFAASGAHAATVTVTSNADSGAGTLREAIANAGSGDTIDFKDDMTIAVASTLAISQNLTIDATGHSVVVDGGAAVGVFAIDSGATVKIAHLVVQNGQTANGGAINNFGTLMLTGSTLSGNTSSGVGGGIYNNGGSVALSNSTLSGNFAVGPGGGIANLGGTVTLTGSTLSGNIASADGGGIYSNSGSIALSNSTLSGNESYTTHGGGIFAYSGTVTFSNSTVSGNFDNFGSGIYYFQKSEDGIYPLRFSNTIVVDDCDTNSDLSPTYIFKDDGGNFTSGNSCPFVFPPSQRNAVLNLGALADNGGPTQTIVPGTGSAAINAVSCANAPLVDQRGYLRPDPASMGSATPCDAGAVEVGSQMSDRIFADGFGPPPVYK